MCPEIYVFVLLMFCGKCHYKNHKSPVMFIMLWMCPAESTTEHSCHRCSCNKRRCRWKSQSTKINYLMNVETDKFPIVYEVFPCKFANKYIVFTLLCWNLCNRFIIFEPVESFTNLKRQSLSSFDLIVQKQILCKILLYNWITI